MATTSSAASATIQIGRRLGCGAGGTSMVAHTPSPSYSSGSSTPTTSSRKRYGPAGASIGTATSTPNWWVPPVGDSRCGPTIVNQPACGLPSGTTCARAVRSRWAVLVTVKSNRPRRARGSRALGLADVMLKAAMLSIDLHSPPRLPGGQGGQVVFLHSPPRLPGGQGGQVVFLHSPPRLPGGQGGQVVFLHSPPRLPGGQGGQVVFLHSPPSLPGGQG